MDQRVLRSNAPPEPAFDFNAPLDSTACSEWSSHYHFPHTSHAIADRKVGVFDSDSDCSDGTIVFAPKGDRNIRRHRGPGIFQYLEEFPENARLYPRKKEKDGKDPGYWPEPNPVFRQAVYHYQFFPYEENSPAYMRYRERERKTRQKKITKDDKQNPWPNDIEYAFQKALRIYGGRGRNKKPLGPKLSGGNEWMAWCIWIQTGVELRRKQVSSHIQVLGGHMKHNLEWLAIAKPLRDEQPQKRDAKGSAALAVRSSRDVHTPLKQIPAAIQTPAMLSLPAPMNGAILPSNHHQGPLIHSIAFGMYLRSKCEKSIEPRPRAGPPQHTYTRLQSDRASAPKDFSDVYEWLSVFPDLRLHDEAGLQVPTFLFEAGIKLKEDHAPNTVVEVDLNIFIGQGAGYHGWSTVSEIHKANGGRDSAKKYPDVFPNHYSLKLQGVHLGAGYWAELFGELYTDKRRAEWSGDEKKIRHAEAEARHCLDNVRLHQQLWATPSDSHTEKCIATLLWRFHAVGTDVSPTTSWRPLSISGIAPNPYSDLRMPMVNQGFGMEASASRHQSTPEGQHLAHILDQHSVPDMYTECKDRLPFVEESLSSGQSSPTTGLMTDAGSSTLSASSSSFPPSLSNTTLLTQPSQPSSFESYGIISEACHSFDPAATSQESQASFGAQPIPVKDFSTLLAPFGSQAYGANHDLALTQDSFNSTVSHFADFPPFHSAYDIQQCEETVMTPNEQQLVSGQTDISRRLQHRNDLIDESDYHTGVHSFPKPNEESPAPVYESPMLAPQAQINGHHHNHILQLQHQHFGDLQHGLATEILDVKVDPELVEPSVASSATKEVNESLQGLNEQDQKRDEEIFASTYARTWESEPQQYPDHPHVSQTPSFQEDVQTLNPQRDLQSPTPPHDMRPPTPQRDFHSLPSFRHTLTLPSESHLSAYVSPFNDPLEAANYDRELAVFPPFEQQDCFTHETSESTILNDLQDTEDGGTFAGADIAEETHTLLAQDFKGSSTQAHDFGKRDGYA